MTNATTTQLTFLLESANSTGDRPLAIICSRALSGVSLRSVERNIIASAYSRFGVVAL